jgi:flagellar biosynthesis protein FlhG
MRRDRTHIRVIDQAARLRRLVGTSAADDAARRIAIVSGKGGVGKSSIAVNLAACLAGRGIRVMLIDADIGLANDDVLLGLSCPQTLGHVLDGSRRLDEVVQSAPGGFGFVAGPSSGSRWSDVSAFECQRLVDEFTRLEQDTDIVLLDCGAGINQAVLTFALACDTVLVVTTPEPTAMADGYAMIKTLAREGYNGRVSLLVNMATSRAEARAIVRRIAEVAKNFLKYPVADGGYLLQDNHVERAVLERCPFVLQYPRCPATACLGAVAVRMARRVVPTAVAGGYLRGVVGSFLI